MYIIWYWVNSCRALDLDPNEVIKENVLKLESRYLAASLISTIAKTGNKETYDEKTISNNHSAWCQWM